MSDAELALWVIAGLLYFSFNLKWMDKATDNFSSFELAVLGIRARAFVGILFAFFGMPIIFLLLIKNLILGK